MSHNIKLTKDQILRKVLLLDLQVCVALIVFSHLLHTHNKDIHNCFYMILIHVPFQAPFRFCSKLTVRTLINIDIKICFLEPLLFMNNYECPHSGYGANMKNWMSRHRNEYHVDTFTNVLIVGMKPKRKIY